LRLIAAGRRSRGLLTLGAGGDARQREQHGDGEDRVSMGGNAARQGVGSHPGPPRVGKVGCTLQQKANEYAFLFRVLCDVPIDQRERHRRTAAGPILYEGQRGRLLYAINPARQRPPLNLPEADLTVMTRGFRVFSNRLRRSTTRGAVAAAAPLLLAAAVAL